MRSFRSTRSRALAARERFQGRVRRASKDPSRRTIVRFRRNRERMARSLASVFLWAVAAVMLVGLGKTLWRVAQTRLVDRSLPVRLMFPAAACLAIVFSLLRARAAYRDWRESRAEQRALTERLERERDDPGV
jgi:hypothetical protein